MTAIMLVKPKDRILRISDAAAILGISVSTLYDWLDPKSKRFVPGFPEKIRFGNACSGILESELLGYISSWIL